MSPSFKFRSSLALCVWSGLLLAGCQPDPAPKPEDRGPEGTTGVETQKPPDQTKDFDRAFELKAKGLAYLENMDWTEAEAALSELVKVAPDQLLPRRNLAILRTLAIVSESSPYSRSGSREKAQEYDQAVEAATEAIDDFLAFASKYAANPEDRTGNQAIAHLLMGQVLVHRDALSEQGIKAGVSELQRAVRLRPESASLWFALASAMDGDANYTDASQPESAELLKALATSTKLAPDNLFALQKLMQRQALFLNSSRETPHPETHKLALTLPETLRTAQQLLKPLNESIKAQRNQDLVDMIQQTLENYDPDRAIALMGPSMMTANLLRPELATQLDQRRIDRNLLHYVLINFPESFHERAVAAGFRPALQPTVVKSFSVTPGLPDLQNVTAFDMVDMNLDGRDDLVVARGTTLEVYSRDSNGENWNVLMSASTEARIEGFVLADLDRDDDKTISELKSPVLLRDQDGDQKIVQDPVGQNRWYDADFDVLLWTAAGVSVYRNDTDEDGMRSLQPLPQQHDVSGVNQAVAADLDADGDLDFAFATNTGLVLWKNLNGAQFEEIDSEASVPQSAFRSLIAVDLNRNVAMDIVALSADGKIGCLENLLHGRFRWLQELPPIADHLSEFGLLVAAEGTAPAADPIRLCGLISGVVPDRQFRFAGDDAVAADFDNDGFLDLIIQSEGSLSATRLFRANPYTEYAREPFEVEFPTDLKFKQLKANDFDSDGDLDVVGIDVDGRPQLLINEGGNTNHWLDVVVRGKPDDPQFTSNRVNLHGIGTVLQLRAGELFHEQVVDGPKVHLGLGQRSSADALRLIWTDGIPQNIVTNRYLNAKVGVLAPQILIGSCPYIYTWTGEQFEFFSDCLWAAPLGLTQANGELAPTREWEHLLIPARSLKARGDHYALQLTEELYETAYFDQVRLTAVDHPADLQIFTNEKVGSPQLAAERIHTVAKRLQPATLTDKHGRDLKPALQQQDGNYVQPFDARILQGLTDEWTLEFDISNLSNSEQPLSDLRLFLTGWVFPTDTSLNAHIHQNPDLQPPLPPLVEVPTKDGDWQTLIPFIGFPSGKTKAMVVDLAEVAKHGHTRFRIRSSMELYWDEAFLTVNETDAEVSQHDCGLLYADLHYRGFSRRRYADNALFRDGYAPEDYDYQSVRKEPRWPAIGGRFTRYGDTFELLTEHDDRMVVMSPGDELTLFFAVPEEPVPEGWARDFVLTNVGYDKDANLNTIYGQSSEPLPFRAMSRYPFAADATPPDSPAYQRYLDEWQTRRQKPSPFWNTLKSTTDE